MRSKYIIREVDGTDEDVVETLDEIHYLCFFKSAPPIDHAFDLRWWFAYDWSDRKTPVVAFGGLTPSCQTRNAGYLYRAGVLQSHRGHGLQRRLLRVREAAARRMGWTQLVTDTAGNIASSNNLITAGYKIFTPACPWSFASATYWKKLL